MQILPPPGPERRKQLVRLGILTVLLAAALWYKFGPTPGAASAATPGVPAAAQRPAVTPSAAAQAAAAKAASPALPEALRLAELEPVPTEPAAGRNPFRFGVRPPPPPPPAPPPPVYVPPPPPPPPGPPPVPPIPLKFKALFVVPVPNPDGTSSLQKCAMLSDGKGGDFKAFEGQVVDGRYRVVKIGDDSVIVEYVDGTGRRSIPFGM